MIAIMVCRVCDIIVRRGDCAVGNNDLEVQFTKCERCAKTTVVKGKDPAIIPPNAKYFRFVCSLCIMCGDPTNGTKLCSDCREECG